MESYVNPLLDNSKNALFAAIEIHNKPVFPYRYQICTIALINAWELILKAFIARVRPDVKLIADDGTSKPFEECLACVKSTIGKGFLLESESLEHLYRYRCDYIHFYQDNIDTILYALFAKSVELYNRFSITYFGRDVSDETNLVLLPVGFKPPVSPIDFLSKKSDVKQTSKEVKLFIENVLTSASTLLNEGINEPIMQTFNIAMIHENRASNADIVAAIAKEGDLKSISIRKILTKAAITNDPKAQAIKIDEESLFKDVYTESYQQVLSKSRELFPDFIVNNKFHQIMKDIKKVPAYYRIRYLDIKQETGTGGKGYFSNNIYEQLAKYFTPR